MCSVRCRVFLGRRGFLCGLFCASVVGRVLSALSRTLRTLLVHGGLGSGVHPVFEQPGVTCVVVHTCVRGLLRGIRREVVSLVFILFIIRSPYLPRSVLTVVIISKILNKWEYCGQCWQIGRLPMADN